MIAACYTVFNGEELLEASMRQMTDVVDFFVICYQTTSNKGNKNPNLEAFLMRFNGNKRVILVSFIPNLSINTKQNERNKHNLMLETARIWGAKHVILSACDHFYDKNQLSVAVRESIVGDFDVTFTGMYTYYKHPTWQISPHEAYFMPLVIKLHPETSIVQTKSYPLLVDPSVKVNTYRRWHLFPMTECVLHHYSMIRTDINSKFDNAAASIRWTPDQVAKFKTEYADAKIGDCISYFQNRKLIDVENYFGL